MYLSYGHQWISEDDINEVVNVLRSDWLSQGPMIERFEDAVADYVGAKYAVAFANGTAALHAAMYASGLKAGDKGLTAPMTFAATSNSMLYVGAEPVFADITLETCCLDPVEAEKKMANDVKVIVPISFAAYPVDIAAFRKIANKWGAVLIEDGCQALGSVRNGVKVGCEADMTAFSFHPVKSITTGEGGMVTTNNPEYAKSMKLFRTHGITKNPDEFEFTENASCGWYGEMQSLGYNYRLTDFQCVLGYSQMKRLPEFIERRKEIAAQYFKKLDGTPHLTLQPYHEGHGWHLFMIFVDPDKRLGLFNHLKKNDIGAQVHYVPIHLQPYYRRMFGYKEGMFPKAESMYRREISIPIYPAMSDSDVDRVVEVIRSYLE
jgi:UDP-4-amino-4,6-dideoxy-N-acetyl-beta-L-altrosamine transaminase